MVQPDEIPERIKSYKLHWSEVAKLTKQYHEYMQLLKGTPNPKGGSIKTGWGLRDTANELDRSLGSVWNDMEILKTSETYPKILTLDTLTKAMEFYNSMKKNGKL